MTQVWLIIVPEISQMIEKFKDMNSVVEFGSRRGLFMVLKATRQWVAIKMWILNHY